MGATLPGATTQTVWERSGHLGVAHTEPLQFPRIATVAQRALIMYYQVTFRVSLRGSWRATHVLHGTHMFHDTRMFQLGTGKSCAGIEFLCGLQWSLPIVVAYGVTICGCSREAAV